MLGSTVDRVVPPDGREERRRTVSRALAEGHSVGTHSRLHRDGTLFRIEMRMHLIRDKGGEPLAVVALVAPLPGHGALLTSRQKEILEQIAHGRTNDEIAERLVISRRTVERHVEAIFDRLGAENRAPGLARVTGEAV
jgi:DNA-binding NarL/FixJ family response regulator